jgi:site-specific DNA-methyltransferase (adenine-specific)
MTTDILAQAAATEGIKPYYERDGITIFNADCRDVLPLIAHHYIDLLVADPPYGFRKADWDSAFQTDWLEQAAEMRPYAMAIMPGVNNILRMPRTIGRYEYRWMLSMHLTNGMTRGLMGFGNWIPVLVYATPDESLHQPQQDATAVPVVGEMPAHPSPKPLRAMTWLVSRFKGRVLLDPFMGSGTTLVAAKQMGWRAIGIEIEERYCEIAARRLEQSVLPLAM